MRVLMPVVLTLVIGGAALYVILANRYSSETQKWASGVIGMILGYWFKQGPP